MRDESELLAALRLWEGSHFFPYATIKLTDHQQFDFCPPDEPSALLAEIAWLHDCPDHRDVSGIVAWEMGEPEEFWSWDLESHPIMGWDYLLTCQRHGNRVRLVRTAAEWLQQVGCAVCIVNWQAPIRAIFGDVAVFTPDDELQKRYSRAWRRWQRPRPNLVRENRDG